jgi:hypothetical protein
MIAVPENHLRLAFLYENGWVVRHLWKCCLEKAPSFERGKQFLCGK